MSNAFPRIRTPIPSGHVLGRASSGTGVVEAIPFADLATKIISTGLVVPSGGQTAPQWVAGGVTALDASLVIVNGTLTVTALPGVTAIGAGLTIVGGTTLEAATGSSHIYAPLVTGDTLGYIGLTAIYGPYPIIDPHGQFIMVPTT